MKNRSIRISILLAATMSLLALATVMLIFLSKHEVERIQANTQSLVREQIELTVKKLDIYRVVNQISYILNITFNLDRVNGVNIFDSKCNLVDKQPVNFKIPWDCKSPHPDSMVLYKSQTSISDSSGAPKYILARLKDEPHILLNHHSLKVLVISLVLILITLLCLNFLMKKHILRPIDELIRIIRKPGALERNSQKQQKLPLELREIYNDVLSRDEIIQQNKIELLKRNEMETRSHLSEQVAHDIRSPIMILRDYHLNHLNLHRNEDTKESVYLNAINDLDLLTKQLIEDSSEYAKNVNLVGLMDALVDMKEVEFQQGPKSKILLNPQSKNLKIKTNPTKLKFVLSNIINNAREASKKDDPCEIQIKLTRKGSNAFIEIEDNGKGIKESDIKRVFSRGVSIDKPGGNGWGLSDAKKFIESQDGTIEIESKLNKGTTVKINLPILLSNFQSRGKAPFDHVLVEDYKLSQLLWLEKADSKKLNFAAFSSPSEFLENMELVSPNATLYIDSHFPDFPMRGEEWARELYSKYGFKKIYMCSTSPIDITDMPWIKACIAKHKPFDRQLKEMINCNTSQCIKI